MFIQPQLIVVNQIVQKQANKINHSNFKKNFSIYQNYQIQKNSKIQVYNNFKMQCLFIKINSRLSDLRYQTILKCK